jgi:type IV pilus assembly protein PilB
MSGLARALLQAGRLTQQQAETVARQAANDKIPFIDALLSTDAINAAALAAFCSETFGYPMLDIGAFNQSLLPEKLLDPKLMQSQRVIALAKRGNKVSVAISDPTNAQALEQIKFQTEMMVEPIIVDHGVLLKLLEKLGQSAEQSLNELVGDDLDNIDFAEDELAAAGTDGAAPDIDDAPVVKFLQ